MLSNRPQIEASEWLSRIDAGDVSPQTNAALAAWRAADPRQEVAYLRLKAGWNRLDRLQSLRPADGIDADLFAPPDTAQAARRLGPRLLLAAMLALAVGVGWF